MTGDLRSVSISYETKLENYVALYRFALASRHPNYRRDTWILLTVLFAALLASVTLGTTVGIIASGVALLLLCLRFGLADRLAKKRWRRTGAVGYEATLDPTGLTTRSEGQTISISWSTIEELQLRSNYLYLRGGEIDTVIALRNLPQDWTPQTLYDACCQWRAAAIA